MLSQVDVLQSVLIYFPNSSLSFLQCVSRVFYVASQRCLRERAQALLLKAVGPAHPDVAWGIEEELFSGCGGRSGPGAYNSKLRELSTSLRNNSALVGSLAMGEVSFHAVVRFSKAQLLTAAAASNVASIQAAARQRARLQAPRPNFFACPCPLCGEFFLFRENYLKIGSWDVTKSHTKYTCLKCEKQVDVVPSQAMAFSEGRGACGDGAAGADAAAPKPRREEEEKEEEEEEEEEAVDLGVYFIPQPLPTSGGKRK